MEVTSEGLRLKDGVSRQEGVGTFAWMHVCLELLLDLDMASLMTRQANSL